MEGQKCRICGCTDMDCSQCIRVTGKPCHWVEEDLCSACQGAIKQSKHNTDMSFFKQLAAVGNIDITMRIMQKGDKLTMNIMPGSAKSVNKPFNITGTAEELDEHFFTEVFPAVQEIKGLVMNKEEVIKELNEKPAAKPVSPKAADKKKSGKAKPVKKSKAPVVKEASLFEEGNEENGLDENTTDETDSSPIND